MIAIGSDHGGYRLKEEIKKYLDEKNIEYKDFGCQNEENKNTNTTCPINEYMMQITSDSSLNEISEMINAEGVLNDIGYNEYQWNICNDVILYVSFNEFSARIDLPYDMLSNKNIDLSKILPITEQIDNNEKVTYEDIVEALNDNYGTLIKKDLDSYEYIWVDKENNYLIIAFSNEDNSCIRIDSQMHV